MPPRSLHLPGELRSVPLAREFVRGALRGAVPDAVVDDAVLVASELVTNAVVHAGTPSELVLDLRAGVVDLRLSDGNRRRPVRRRAVGDPLSSGRGLGLVDVLSVDWGIEVGPSGKTVWARLSV